MVRAIVGGVITVIIGGTTYAVHQSDVTKNFANQTGMTQQQAQQYVSSVKGVSWTKVGQSFIDDGNSAINDASQLDCENYTYQWETPTLSCNDGKSQFQSVGNDEITLGNCYKALDTDLGNSTKPKVGECITDINTVTNDYTYPVVTSVLDSTTITDANNTNAYNKSVLEAVLSAN